MKTQRIGLTLLLTLLVASGTVAAAALPNRLDWYVLTGNGGGQVSSTHYKVDFTVGQTVVGKASSTHYGLGLGYWAGVVAGAPPGPTLKLYLPLILKSYTVM